MNQALKIIEDIPWFGQIQQVDIHLRTQGCTRCDLGFQPEINGCCVMRGSHTANKMIIGEAPGRYEDSDRQPFTGPAGQLLDKIWTSVGMNTNDWYLTNVVKCRPVAPHGSGKENFTPKVEQRERCRPYFEAEIQLLKPKLIVTIGAIATAAVFNQSSVRIGDYSGREYNIPTFWDGTLNPVIVFPFIHPAAILHASSNPAKEKMYKQQSWDDIRKLKKIIEENNL